MVALFWFSSPLIISWLGAIVVLMAALSRLGLPYYFKGSKPALWVGLLTLFFWGIFGPGPHLQNLPLSEPGLQKGALFAGRFLILVLLSSVVTLTTEPLRLTEATERLLRPLRWIGVPVADLAWIATSAFRFVPVLALETERLVKAQLARGAKLDHGSPWERLLALKAVILPLFLRAFRHAEHLADSLESRGYRGERHRRPRRGSAFGWVDLQFFLVLALCLSPLILQARA